VYRLAGISRLDVPTTLLIIAGYDTERTKQLVRYYEPRNLVIGLQSGEQYDNIKKNRDKNFMAFDRNDEIRWFDVDGYDLQNTIEAVEVNVKDFQKDTNVVLSSLGPKISALALYKYHLDHDNSALSYAPSNEFNRDYSHGLGETLSGQL
jgi:broad specificity phosphatase PhoE